MYDSGRTRVAKLRAAVRVSHTRPGMGKRSAEGGEGRVWVGGVGGGDGDSVDAKRTVIQRDRIADFQPERLRECSLDDDAAGPDPAARGQLRLVDRGCGGIPALCDHAGSQPVEP